MTTAALAGVATFLTGVLLLHVLQPALDPWRDAVSYYVHGRGGWLLALGLLALAAGSAALTTACAIDPHHAVGRPALALLGIWTLGVGLGGAFPADPPGHWDRPPSAAGAIHGLAAIAGLTALPVAAWLASRRLRSTLPDRSGRLLFSLSVCLAVAYLVFAASLVPVFVTSGPPWLMGLTERVLLLSACAWLAATAWALRSETA